MGNGERLTETICVSLVDVRISERRRRSTNASKVEQYRLWLEQGREAPPVRLARDGVGYVVRDGRHRVLAAVAAGHADIEAVLSAIARTIRRLTRRAERMRRRELPRARAVASALPLRPTWGCLVAEHLACNEEERVRLPPSPLSPP